jgi:DNA primase
MNDGEELLKVVLHYNLVDKYSVNDKFKIVCPFHSDLNASMQIDLNRGKYYCYGCNAKGNAKDFIKHMENCNDLRSLVILNKILNGGKKKNIQVTYSEVKTNEEYLEEAKLYFYSLSQPEWKCIKNSYMHSRGFNSKTLTKVDARINASNDYGIILPMLDNGEFKGYVCRATNKEVEKERKYLYNKGFNRRDTLVGNYFKNWVVVVEGYMDWLKLVQFGVKNCCAILGWKITKEQIIKLKTYTNKIICALDNTETGDKGFEYLKNYFEVVRFQFPENVKDPGELDIYNFRKSWADTMDLIKIKNKKE